jgi:hypothetical protein
MSEQNSMSQTKCNTSGRTGGAGTTKAAQGKYNRSAKGKARYKRWKDKNPMYVWCSHARENARRRAKKYKLPFDLSSDYLRSIVPAECPVFRTPFVFVGNKVQGPESPSLDRIVPEKGYVEGNVVIISLKANQIKSAYGLKDIKRVAEWMEEQGY